jgi:predicted O-methyltransferase YrrM
LVENVSKVEVRLAPSATRHGWSLGAAEQLILQVLIRGRRCRTAFEIGTFNGGTTRVIAESLPSDGKVWTIDLPAGRFAATQQPHGFAATDVGVAYRDSPGAKKITQLFGDSLDYDFGPYLGSADLVLVDAGHEYRNGFSDTKTALRIVSGRGLIVWDDFTPYWYGLVNGICDAMNGRSFGTLAGTALAVYVSEGDG